MRALVPLFAAALALALGSCAPKAPARQPCPQGQICVQIGNTTEPLTLDPHTSTGTWEDRIISDMFVGLTQSDPEGKPVPGMAERWEVTPDGKLWTFHLRQAKWSDGVPVTADDVVFSFQRVLDPKLASEYASLLYFIKGAQEYNEGKAPAATLGVRAVDPRTVQIELLHPAPYLPELTKHHTTYIVPKHAVQKWGDPGWLKPEHFVSNGPYKLAAWRLGDYVKAVKNPLFYEADKVCIDQIYYYPTTDAISAERRIKRGELDINTDIQSNRISFLRKEIPDYVRVHTYMGLTYLAFAKNVPAFRDKRVRTALNMAIDRDFITQKLLRGGQLSAYQFVPPGVANYTSPPLPEWASWRIEKRHAEARRLLAEAGYGPGHPLRIEIKQRNTPDPMLYTPAVQADWKAIGVDVQLLQEETQIAYADYRARSFQVADAAWIADYNDPMSFLYLGQSGTGAQNYPDYNNPAFDALLAKADNEPDARKRAQYLAQAEAIYLDDSVVAPIYYYVNKNLVNPKITGWVDNIVDHHRSRYLCVKAPARGG